MGHFYNPPQPFVGGTQPDAGHLGNIPSEAVPVNPPPPSYPGRTPQAIAATASAWIPLDPNPTLPLLDAALASIVISRVPSALKITIWPIVDPLPTLPRNLPPFITAIDNPPFAPDYNQPQLGTILTGWTPPDPTPTQRALRQIVSVDNPPVRSVAWTISTQATWIPPDPSPFIGGWQALAPRQLAPAITAVQVDTPVNGYRPALLGAWPPADPLPILPALDAATAPVVANVRPFGGQQPEYWTVLGAWSPPLVLETFELAAMDTGVQVDNPPGPPDYNQPQIWPVLSSWAPPDPAPTQRGPKTFGGAAVVNPPPVRSGSWLTSAQVAWLPPDPPAFMGDWQPLALGKVPPSIADVPANNPPFLTPPVEASIRTQWDIPPPLPTLGVKALQPFVSPPVGQPVALWTWLSSILSGWVAPDPVPTMPRWLPAQLTAVAVNNPPFGEYLSVQTSAVTLADWRPPDPLPTLTVKAVQPFIAPVGQPVKLWTWLSTVLSDWTPPDPTPTLPRWLPAQLTAVRVDTPIGLTRWLQAVAAPDPLPTLPRPGVPGAAVAAAQVPHTQSWLTTILAAWTPSDPAPIARAVSPTILVNAPVPFSTGWIKVVLQGWAPPDPAPTQRQPTRQTISVDRPPIPGITKWIPGVLGAWKSPDPLPALSLRSAITTPPPVVNAPPPIERKWLLPLVRSWEPPPPLFKYGFSYLYTPQPPGIPTHGRWTFLQPELKAVFLQPETKALLLQSDIRGVLLIEPDTSDMDPINIAPLVWSAASPNDVDWYYLLLDIWLPSGDTVNSPTVTITPIVGDLAPPSVTGIAVETGAVSLTVAPGLPYVSNGPRIKCKIAGGSVGNTYSTVVGWQDSQGRTLSRTVLLPIEAR